MMFRTLVILLSLIASFLTIDQSVGGASKANLVRGPYLQKGDDNKITIHWRTDVATDSRVSYSQTAANLNLSESNSKLKTEHAVKLTNLKSSTKYYYSIGSDNDVLATGPQYFFYTFPDNGASSNSTRIWVIGDSGTGNTNSRQVRNAYTRFAGKRYTDVWLMLGDNAYESGTDHEYQIAVFKTYKKLLRQTVLWPTMGNHDVVLDNTTPRKLPYHEIFNLPKRGESGGVPSRSEEYYSFNHGSIHFVSLDSTSRDRSPNGPMLTWLKKDLEANKLPWVIAFWHHAPYSKGSHDSDESTGSREMREYAMPIVENYGVDLVLSGDSHSYQRSYLMFGHYGSSSTFRDSMILDNGSGREEQTGPYEKPFGKSKRGTIYAVVGSSGKLDDEVLRHPAMFIALKQRGSLVLDVNQNRLDGKFLDSTGAIDDHFSLVKN